MSKNTRNFILIFLGFVIFSFSITFSLFGFISKKMGKEINYLPKVIANIKEDNKYSNKEKINFMILGLDERNDSLEKTETTDTIIFASLNLKNYKINTISLPRDLWSYSLNQKINEIYPQSLNQADKFSYIKDNFKYITGQDIDHVIIINTNSLVDFVKLIGGVDLNLDQGFIDNKYPNPEYIKNPSKEVPVYKTIEFKSGPVHLDESNITEFVRSRKGGETAAQGGTDIARIQRQQLLIEAIIDKIKSGKAIQNPSQVFDFYKFWDQKIIKDITDIDVIEIFSLLDKNISNLSINKSEIKVGETNKDGLIYHPTKFINKQWVFIPSTQDYQGLHEFIGQSTN